MLLISHPRFKRQFELNARITPTYSTHLLAACLGVVGWVCSLNPLASQSYNTEITYFFYEHKNVHTRNVQYKIVSVVSSSFYNGLSYSFNVLYL